MSSKRLMNKYISLTTLGVLCTMAGAQQSGVEDHRPAPQNIGPIFPTDGSNSGNPFIDSLDEAIRPPMHPPIDELLPIPMPESAHSGIPSLYRGLTIHDGLTGETTELPAERLPFDDTFQQSSAGEYRGIAEYDAFIEQTYSFGTMTAAGNLDTYPRSPNVKLVMAFTDTTGTQTWFVGSGTMGDSGVVLTAAHCVYMRTFVDNSGITRNVFDWADIVYAYPAWDGIGPQAGAPATDAVIDNFGYAFGSLYLAGSDWINNGDFDGDCGLVRITRGGSRNVGMLTGWFGWAYGGSCSTIKNRTYHNFSYPAETCGGGLHTGRTMYYWNGSFDSCETFGNEWRINCPGNCLDSVWGGMSGSGAYYIDNGDRFVQSICSNKATNNSYGDYTELWSTFVTGMETFEDNTRTSSEDWEPLAFRATGSTSVQAGFAMNADCEVQMINATNFNPGTQDYQVKVYLSSNNNITTSDTLLATWNYNSHNFGAMANVKFIVPAPAIPSGTAPDDYWLGVIIDSGLPGTDANDDTDTWDAQPITVTEPGPHIIFKDDFELDLTKWIRSGPRVKLNPNAARTGDMGVRIRRKQWIRKDLSTEGYRSIVLKASRRAKNFEGNKLEGFKIQWSLGNGWSNLDGVAQSSWEDLEFSLPQEAGNNPNFSIRFKAAGSEAKERGDIDDVEVIGTPL